MTEALKKQGYRVELDAGAEKIGSKIRNHTMQKTPVMLVIGEQEAAARSVNARPYQEVEGVLKGNYSLEAFIEQLKEKVVTKWVAGKVG